ncbi:MAG: amidase [Hyphomicrobiaceae bacterium]|nr:amidase [Hyphomicrobiaceae bacterium]
MGDPHTSQPLWAQSASASIRMLRGGQVGARQLTEAYLARIAEVDGRIHSFHHLAEARALSSADAVDREIAAGRWRSPLQGIPFGVKDNYDVAGLPATAGSRLRSGHVPTRDARLVADLEAAGAVLLGKLATWEYGTGNGGEYFDLPFPPARNPWDTARFTGGSSTGAGAAVAAGTTAFALGSDTTGSVRLPAAACGLVGVILPQGRLSGRGILPNCYSLDVPGPLTWTVEDAALVLDVLLQPSVSYRRSVTRPIAGLRIGVVRGPLGRFGPPDASMAEAFEEAIRVLEQQGARIEVARLPMPVSDCFDVTRLIGPAESAAIHEAELREQSRDMGFALRDKLLAGSMVRAVDYIHAQRQRRLMAEAIDDLVQSYDAIITYGPLRVAPRLGIEPEMTAFTVETVLTPFNLSQHPAIVQCTGYSSEGLPLSWQIVANRHDEATALRIAAAYEGATPWRTMRPTL